MADTTPTTKQANPNSVLAEIFTLPFDREAGHFVAANRENASVGLPSKALSLKGRVAYNNVKNVYGNVIGMLGANVYKEFQFQGTYYLARAEAFLSWCTGLVVVGELSASFQELQDQLRVSIDMVKEELQGDSGNNASTGEVSDMDE